jgi:hypothetical protein
MKFEPTSQEEEPPLLPPLTLKAEMGTRRITCRPWFWCVFIGLVVVPQGASSGQSPDAGYVKVPEWTPADGVSPSIEVTTSEDLRSKLWSYTYRVTNGPAARQALIKLVFIINVPVESAGAPNGWWVATYNPPAALPGVTFAAEQDDAGRWPAGAPPAGKTLTFTIVSRYGPGTVEYYARGDTPALAVEALDAAAQARLPDERQDARRGTAIGPAR